ncbi:MAG: DUF5996 family protein [Gemmatimonadota bacterium]|nr:DUF5996 family protein [Gemmatimonadota bacterium]
MQQANTIAAWPRLTLDEWSDTQTTLHRWAQIVGKTRLALAPMQNHWWQVTLYVTSRGLTTSPIPSGGHSFEVDFDFIDHTLLIRTNEGETGIVPLVARSVADFYADYMSVVRSLGIDVRIWPVPSEMGDTMRFPDDRAHASYDGDAAQRCWHALVQADRALKEFRGRFLGKSSPSHFWWGGFDISCTRFSGRRAPPHPGGIPNLPDRITREAYSHECISAGWWPGTVGSPVAEPAFYAYSYPEPAGCDVAPIKPAGAYYHTQLREWILPYEKVRNSASPEGELIEFFQSTYEAAADLGKWDRSALERQPRS